MVRVTFDVATARTSKVVGTVVASVKSIEGDVSPAHPTVRRIGLRDVSDVLAKGLGDFMESINQNLYLPLA